MATTCLLLFPVLMQFTNASVVSFGIMTASDATHAAVTLTLHWNVQIMQCIIHPSTADTQYVCYANATTTTTCLITSNLYTLHIDHDDSDTLQIQSVAVYTEDTYYYDINSFCLNLNSLQYGTGSLNNNNCSIQSQFLFEDICLDNSNCSSPHIDISFATQVLQHPNSFDKTHGVVTTGSDESGLTCAPTMDPTTHPTLSPTTLSDDYIFLFIGPVSWMEANKYCSDRFGTSLAFIGSSHDNTEAANVIHMETLTHDMPLYTFFGLTMFYDVDLWKFTGDIGYSSPDYYNWDVSAGEPGSDACAMLGESGFWYTTSCTAKQNVSILCNKYSEIINDTWSGKYKYVFVGDISWIEANVFCNTHYNSTLATISSAEDNTELALFASYYYATYAIINAEMFWIGLHDLGSDAEWQWVDSTVPAYYNWSPELDHNVGASCAIEHIYGLWEERTCHDLHSYPFFCNNAITTTSPTTTQSMNVSAVNTTDKNYIRVWMGGRITWVEANEHCRTQYGTHLASITSAQHNTEITYLSILQYMTGSTPTACSFIGLHRMHGMEDWNWIDGSTLNYTYWGSQQPDDDTETCSYMCSDGTWSSVMCTTRSLFAFICNAPTYTTSAPSFPTEQPTFMTTTSSSALNTTTLYRTMFIVFVAATCVVGSVLCLVTYFCYQRNKLLKDALSNAVRQGHGQPQDMCGDGDVEDASAHPIENGESAHI
eukprot:121630_1